MPHEAGPDNDPFATLTRDAFAAWIKKEPLLFAPDTAVLYSNFGFDLLAISLSAAGKKPCPELLKENVTGPSRLMMSKRSASCPGHAPDGRRCPMFRLVQSS